MARRDLKYFTVTGAKGINQQEKLADPVTELQDARNLWAPNGRIEKRPGYWGIGTEFTYATGLSTLTGGNIIVENPLGTFTDTGNLSSLPVESRWYIEFTAIPATENLGLRVVPQTTNSNDVTCLCEYWNGDSWIELKAIEYAENNSLLATLHLSVVATSFRFPWPADLTTKDVTGSGAKYYFRFTVKPAADSALDASTSLGLNDPQYYYYSSSSPYQTRMWFIVGVNYATGPHFIAARDNSTSDSFYNTRKLQGSETVISARASSTYPTYSVDEPPSVAAITQFDETYISYNSVVTVHKLNPKVTGSVTNDDVFSFAAIETDPLLVGEGKRYHPSLIPQIGWPRAKYIAFHRGEMWAANLKDGGATSIRWSAASPAYKVWPQINIDVLADTDQGPITGIYPFNQNMFVGKSDSIWQMVYTGLNDDGLNTYRAEKVVAGVGWVSQNSIQDIGGRLVFLAEDGIYSYDGVRLRKLSDRIQKTINGIVPAKRAFAVSAHWKSKSCYLLAVTTQGNAINNLVLIWDYKNDSWWIWDSIEAVSFLSVEDSSDTEHIYFVDYIGRVFELGVGHHDYGTAISAYGITQQIGDPNVTKKLRRVELNSTNLTNAATIEVQRNDAPFTAATTSTLTLSDSLEDVYGTGVYGTATYVGDRDRDDGIGVLQVGESFRVKFSHSAKNSPFVMNELRAGLLPISVRR